jgi:hypothetical protein
MCINKMTHPTLFIALLFGLFSCGQNYSSKKVSADTTKKSVLAKEVWTVYANQDTVFHVKRLLTSDTGLNLLSYDINTSKPEAASQTFINARILANETEAAKIKSQATTFNWTPFKTTPTLFVQIEPSAFKDEMQALNIRQDVEQKIENSLKAKGLGEWTAGDLGPGGANMLFEVSNIDNAISVILEVLSNAGLDKKTIIGRRINTEAEDWFYEVVYPNNFNGVFLTM